MCDDEIGSDYCVYHNKLSLIGAQITVIVKRKLFLIENKAEMF